MTCDYNELHCGKIGIKSEAQVQLLYYSERPYMTWLQWSRNCGIKSEVLVQLLYYVKIFKKGHT